MITAPVIAGKALRTLMVCRPTPARLNKICPGPLPPLAVLFAAMMASRSDTSLSTPLLALSCSVLKLLPRPVSLVSAVVVTTSRFDTSVTVMLKAWVSVSRPSLTCTVTS